ncbi:hypothetical protein WN51_14426 [Melipona quadrifasciata]|uniref:Uncharacterized protein n=1 Tax=Melipona quadrifasciata TaxID=166423 RepID=A0A0M8ZXX6_9HYME|nr:hypothetical protein WN51_14426 [Melipona quadrifasciata]
MGQLEKPNSMLLLITSGRATKKEIKNKKSYVIVFHCTKNLCEPLFEQTELNRSKKKKEKNKEFAGSIQITCCIEPGEKNQKASRSTEIQTNQ